MKELFHIMKNNKKGYLTIEAAIIFPAVFFSLLLILFMGMVLYQEVNLQSLAVRASERGSVVYASRVSDMSSGVKTLEDFKVRDPYRNLPFVDGGKKEEYRSLVNRYVAGRLGRYDVVRGDVKNSGNYVTVDDYVLSKKIRVNIKSDYKTPVDGMSEMLGGRWFLYVDTTAVSAVVDSPDFVRNVDLAIDVSKAVGIFDKVEKGYNAIKGAIDKVLGWLE